MPELHTMNISPATRDAGPRSYQKPPPYSTETTAAAAQHRRASRRTFSQTRQFALVHPGCSGRSPSAIQARRPPPSNPRIPPLPDCFSLHDNLRTSGQARNGDGKKLSPHALMSRQRQIHLATPRSAWESDRPGRIYGHQPDDQTRV